LQTSGTVTSNNWRTFKYLVSPELYDGDTNDGYTSDGYTSDDYTIQLQAKANLNTIQLHAKANPNIALEINQFIRMSYWVVDLILYIICFLLLSSRSKGVIFLTLGTFLRAQIQRMVRFSQTSSDFSFQDGLQGLWSMLMHKLEYVL
jgi:hypothetical protein